MPCCAGLRQAARAPGGAASLASRIKQFELAAAAQGASSHGGASNGGGSAGGAGGLHDNCIMSICPLEARGACLRFLTAGLDGRVVEWEIDSSSG